MKRRKEIGRLNIENPKPKWHKTVYLKDGKLMKTIHDGSFTQEEDEYSEYLCFEAIEQDSTVKIVSQISNAPDFEYSTDGETWETWKHTTNKGLHIFNTIELENIGDRLYVRGDNKAGLAEMIKEEILFTNFQFTGVIKCFGNIMSLISYNNEITEVHDYGFAYLFSEPEGSQEHPLISTPDMTSITSIGDGGCAYMYYGCASLTSAAEMPLLATIGEGGCAGMYGDCTFDMSDDGETLNFAFLTPPVTSGEDTYATSYDVAEWMGNTNGFDYTPKH